jgi:TetR/AcrR family transcriptional repressor of mexJK operon
MHFEQHFCLTAQSDFLQVFSDVCECTLKDDYLPEAIKLEHVLLELAAEKVRWLNIF